MVSEAKLTWEQEQEELDYEHLENKKKSQWFTSLDSQQ